MSEWGVREFQITGAAIGNERESEDRLMRVTRKLVEEDDRHARRGI